MPRSRFQRVAVSLVACVAALVSGALGFGNGMVLCTDAHGHVAIEPAHDRHAHNHRSEPHDDGGDPHDDEHHPPGDQEPCSDEDPGPLLVKRASDGTDATRLVQELNPLAPMLSAPTGGSCGSAGMPDAGPSPGPAPGAEHPELARLRTVVLLV